MANLVGTFGRIQDGWRDLEHARGVRSEVLVRVTAGGREYLIGTNEIDVPRVSGGELVHFQDGFKSPPEIRDQLDPRNGSSTHRSLSLVVDAAVLPMNEIRASGVLLQDADVDVWWWPDADVTTILALNQADHVISGKMTNPLYDEETGIVQFRVEDERFDGDEAFPPIIATQDRLTNLDDEHVGKVYPVVIGDVKKLPCLHISADETSWLVMDDTLKEHTGTQVTAMYDADDSLSIDVQDQANDADGNGYYYVDLSMPPTPDGLDVTADVAGHSGDSVAGALRYLVTHYSNHADTLDFGSLNAIRERLQGFTLGMAVNERTNGGVLAFIQQRIVPQVPVVMLQRGGKIRFIDRLWGRRIQRVLRTDVDLLRKTQPPLETPRQDIFNSFVVRYGRSCFRGDHTGVVERNKDNDHDCLKSKQWHGERAMAPVDAGDLADLQSADLLAKWLIETYSKMRVTVGYECAIGSAVGLDLWDTVQVYDDWEGWTHGPLFKVVGLRRGAGTTIGLDLLSLDDYARTYDVLG